jgi:murein L,D-transpeptidase YcbB/YkuD
MGQGWRLAGSLEQLLGEVDARWPGRDRSSDGSIGDAAHRSRVSDHNPDAAGVVRALDVDDNDSTPAERGIGDPIAGMIVARRDPRVKYVIYQGRILRSYDRPGVAAWSWAPYTGANRHDRHLHVSVVADDRADDRSPWGVQLVPAVVDVAGPFRLPVLRMGARGEAVRRAQGLMAAARHVIAVDGSFGPDMDRQVRAYQAARGLAADGSVGAVTWAWLHSVGVS